MRTYWTLEQIEILKDKYPVTLTDQLAVELNKTIGSVYDKAASLGIKKTPEFFLKYKSGRLVGSEGISTRFRPGFSPWNKGRKGYENSSKTKFTTGHVPANHKQVGSVRLTTDGYLMKKTEEPRKWELSHRLVWEEHFGEIPTGMIVKFVDGNTQNIDPQNLYLADRKTNMLQNSIVNYPEDLRSAMHSLKKLKNLISNGTEQN
jgi:hypothetical protein